MLAPEKARQQLGMDSGARRYCKACCSCTIAAIIATYVSVFRFGNFFHKVDWHKVDRRRVDRVKVDGVTSNSAEQAGEDSGTRVAARISLLGNLTIDVAQIMQLDKEIGYTKCNHKHDIYVWQFYQDFGVKVVKRIKEVNDALAKSEIAKASAAILKEDFYNAMADNGSNNNKFYIPHPLLNQNNTNDSFDYYEHFFMDEAPPRQELKELLAWRNPVPIKPHDLYWWQDWTTIPRTIEWNIFSAVPVASHSGNQGPMLALIGQDSKETWNYDDPRDVPFAAVAKSRHFVIFPSGEIKPFKKHRRQPDQGGDTMTWFAELPPADEAAWMYPPQGTQHSCLTFGILDASEHFLKNFTSCHNPSTLPPAGAQYGFTLCFSVPPLHDPNKPEYSAYLHMPQTFMYHLRHGVDQVVVYLSVQHREHALALLKPFTTRRKCTIIFLDSRGTPHQAIENESSQNDYRMYDLGGPLVMVENWLHNDCLNRFRGRSQFVANMGWDEFIYAPGWRTLPDWAASNMSLQDELQPLLSNACVHDFNVALSYTWFKPADPLKELLLTSTEHYADHRRGYTIKALNKAGCVSSVWVHLPADCFGRACSEFPRPLLEFAHIRALQSEKVVYMGKEEEDPTNKTVVSDTLFADELALFRPELCRWMQEAGFGCQPWQWFPKS